MDTSNVCGVIYASRCFTYVKSTKRFMGELSITPAILRQLWVDSLDLGFGIKSDKTGRVIFFTLDSVNQYLPGKFNWWIFKVHNPENDPKLEGLTVMVVVD